jgi:XTP/dITP diphosphohydrolase
MLNSIVIATANKDKFAEISQILKGIAPNIFSLQDFPQIETIEEKGSSFQENSLIKARNVFGETGLLTLADDSGLEVDALNGAPGIYSARYAGEPPDHQVNNRKLLRDLHEIPDHQRAAQFRCVVAIVGPKIEQVVEGIVTGRIIRELRGDKGFGYDPLFVPDGFEQTFAELGEEIKNQMSHRARAFLKVRKILEDLTDQMNL